VVTRDPNHNASSASGKSDDGNRCPDTIDLEDFIDAKSGDAKSGVPGNDLLRAALTYAKCGCKTPLKELTRSRKFQGSVRFQGSLPRVPPAGRFPGPGFERSREPR
jgi:hypothetical protein